MAVWLEKRGALTVVRWDEWATEVVDGAMVRVRTKHTSHGYPLAEKARIAARELEARLPRRSRFRSNGPRPHTDAPLEDLIEQWGASKLAESPPGIQPYTVGVYRDAIGRVIKLRSWKTARDVTKMAVLDWRQAVGGRGFARPFAYLRSVLRWAHAERGQWVDEYVLHPPRQSHGPRRQPPGHLLSDAEFRKILAAARKAWAPSATLIHCLAVYGARGASYARMKVKDYDRKRKEWTVWHVKHSDPLTHPLFPSTCAMLDKITRGRLPDEPLFVSPWNEAWRIDEKGRCQQLSDWYGRLADSTHASQTGIYALKYLAISRMKRGLQPWPRPLASIEGIKFTGHKLTASFDAYERTNQDELRALVGIARGAVRGNK